jgi:ligand-binding SRPBCC domain-containing protein
VTVRFTLVTPIAASPESVFDLSLDVGLHLRSMAGYDEELVGVDPGRPLTVGDEVTWRARHLGIRWTLTTRVVELDRPRRFVDEQVRGPFAAFRHEHEFAADGDGCVMTDHVVVDAPLGLLGDAVERVVLGARMRHLIEVRNTQLRLEAERTTR